MGSRRRSSIGQRASGGDSGHCLEPGCRKPVWDCAPGRGFCAAHYQWHRRRTPGFIRIRERLPDWLRLNGSRAVAGMRFLRVVEALATVWGCAPREALERVEGSR